MDAISKLFKKELTPAHYEVLRYVRKNDLENGYLKTFCMKYNCNISNTVKYFIKNGYIAELTAPEKLSCFYTVVKLRELLKKMNIGGASRLKKEQLISLIFDTLPTDSIEELVGNEKVYKLTNLGDNEYEAYLGRRKSEINNTYLFVASLLCKNPIDYKKVFTELKKINQKYDFYNVHSAYTSFGPSYDFADKKELSNIQKIFRKKFNEKYIPKEQRETIKALYAATFISGMGLDEAIAKICEILGYDIDFDIADYLFRVFK